LKNFILNAYHGDAHILWLPSDPTQLPLLQMRAPYQFVNCVAEEEEQTVNLVEQFSCVTAPAAQFDATLAMYAHQTCVFSRVSLYTYIPTF
jgi:hypothetical protein